MFSLNWILITKTIYIMFSLYISKMIFVLISNTVLIVIGRDVKQGNPSYTMPFIWGQIGYWNKDNPSYLEAIPFGPWVLLLGLLLFFLYAKLKRMIWFKSVSCHLHNLILLNGTNGLIRHMEICLMLQHIPIIKWEVMVWT